MNREPDRLRICVNAQRIVFYQIEMKLSTNDSFTDDRCRRYVGES